MLLSARILADVQSVNSFRYSQQAQVSQGDAFTLYIQLVDASLDRAAEGFQPAGRRYMPAAGAVLTVTLGSLNNAKQVVRVATQPYAQDPSIWAVTILATDNVRGTMPLFLSLNEAGKITTGMLQNALAAFPNTGTPTMGF